LVGLHVAAVHRISEIVAALMAMEKRDINATCTMGRTGLAWAAIGGHEDEAKFYYSRRTKADIAETKCGRTPLVGRGGRA